LNALPFSIICEVECHGSLRLESEHDLCNLISKGTETIPDVWPPRIRQNGILLNECNARLFRADFRVIFRN
jgi:hypothetical protein